MSVDITSRQYVVTLSNDREQFIPYRPRRDLKTVVTVKEGERVTITYVSGSSSYWYADVHGSYPLSEPQEVCACSPGVHKTRQQVSVRIGYPDRRDAHVPAWVYRAMLDNRPEWFTDF